MTSGPGHVLSGKDESKKFCLPLCVLITLLVALPGPVQARGPRFEDYRQVVAMSAETRPVVPDGRAADSGSSLSTHPASFEEASSAHLARPLGVGAGGLILWLGILIVAGPTVLVLFYVLTGRPLPEWARARTFGGALKAIFNSDAKEAVPTIRADFDANRFLREAKGIFLQVQTRSKADVAGDWKTLLAPGPLAELEVQGRAPLLDAVEKLEAEFLGVDADDNQQLARARFTGLVGDGVASIPIAQVWEFSRPRPAGSWVVTDIEVIDAVAATSVNTAEGQTVYRLAPRMSRRRLAWTSLAIGLVLGAVGSTLLNDAFGQDVQALWDLLDGNLWVEFLVGGAFCLTGALALWRAIVTFLSMGRHETIIEVMPLRFARSSSVRITFRQPGPLSLKSLRANLVGLETWREHRDKRSRDLGTHELLDSGPQEVLPDHPYETTVTLRVPRYLCPSGPTADGHEVEWFIEVWGKASGGVDFAQSYLVQIC